MATPETVILTVDKALKSVLGGSAALSALVGMRIFRDKAPKKTTYPAVVFAYQSGSIQRVVGDARFVTTLTYAVRAITRVPGTTADLADQIAATFDPLLEAYSSGRVLSIKATALIARAYTETDETGRGVQYEERGAFYEVLVQGG